MACGGHCAPEGTEKIRNLGFSDLTAKRKHKDEYILESDIMS